MPASDERLARVYAGIRADTTDVAKVADATGYKVANVAKIKHHLFLAEHLLDRFVAQGIPAWRARFDPDERIAAAWDRLCHNCHDQADLRLLYHEAAEAWYMRHVAEGYDAAHDAAQKRFPAPE